MTFVNGQLVDADDLNALAVGYGTSLPASPFDGQQYILVDSTTAPTYQWRFRYNSGNSGSYKWEFMGGPDAYAELTTDQNLTSTSYVDLATVTSLTAPRAGVYDCRYGFTADTDAANAWQVLGAIKLGSAATSDVDAAVAFLNTGQIRASVSREQRITLAASDVVKLQFRANTSNNRVIFDRFLRLVPAKVS